MITEVLLKFLETVTIWFVSLMPNISIFQEIGSMAGLVELISSASYFVPFSTLFICLGIWVAVYQAQFLMTIINWVIGKIPTIS